MLITAIAAALLMQQPPGLETPVTLELKTATVPALVQELERQSGVKIHVQGAPLRDFVYARFTNRPLKSALDVLAKLCEAKWVVSDGQIYFSAPWSDDASVDIAARTQVIAEWLQKNPAPPAITKSQAGKVIDESLALRASSLPNPYEKSTKLYAQTPIPRAHLRILHALGAKALAEIPPGESRAYMIEPKGRVLALPASAKAVFKDFESERIFYNDQLSIRGLGEEMYEEGTWIPSLQNYGPGRPEAVNWLLVLHNEDHAIQSELRGFSNYEGYVGLSLSDNMMVAPADGRFKPSEEPDDFAALTDPYTPSPFWRENAKRPGVDGNGAPELSEALRNRLTNLDTDEVLTEFVHDPLHAFSEAKNADVVAIIPDAAFLGGIYAPAQPTTLGQFLRACMSQSRIQQVDGACLVSPRHIIETRRNRIPRPETANYIRTSLANGTPDLDSTADLAVAIEQRDAFMFAISIASMVTGNDPNPFLGEMDVLRLYGHLTPAQRNMAKNEGLKLQFSSLSPPQKKIVEKMLEGRNAGISSNEFVRDIETTTYGGWELEDLIQLKLPNGIPPDALITFQCEKRTKLFGQMEMEDGYKYIGEADIDTIAWSKAYQEEGYPDYFGDTAKAFTFADRTFLQVVVDFGEVGYFAQSLPIGGPAKNAKFVPLGELPQGIQDEYKNKLKEYREQIRAMGGPPDVGNGVRRPPPPQLPDIFRAQHNLAQLSK